MTIWQERVFNSSETSGRSTTATPCNNGCNSGKNCDSDHGDLGTGLHGNILKRLFCDRMKVERSTFCAHDTLLK